MTPQQQASLSAVNTPTPTAASNEPGLFKLLPTAGSVLGGLGGALIPGLGETGIGEIGGSAAGGAIGKRLENALTGQSGGELGAAAEGGIGAGVGGLLGKAAGGIGKGALDMIASKTAPKVAEDVASSATPVAGTAEAAYNKPFVDALSDASSINRMRKQSIDFQPTRDFMQNQMGASNDPAQWRKIANFIAGDPGTKGTPTQGAWLSKQVTNAAANMPGLPKGDVLNQLHGIAQSHGSSLIEPEATDTMGKFLAKGLSQAVEKDPVSGAEVYSPEKLQQMVKDIGNRWASNPLTMDSQAQTTNAKVIEHEALPEVKDFLNNLVNNRGGVDEAIAKDSTTGEQAARIMAEAPTPQAGKYVIDAMNNGKTAAEVNAAARPAVHADKIAKEVINYQKGIKPVAQQGKDVATAQTAADREAQQAANEAAKAAGKPSPFPQLVSDIAGAAMPGVGGKVNLATKVVGAAQPAINQAATAGASTLGKLPMRKIGALAGGALGTLGGSAAASGSPDLTGGVGMTPPGMAGGAAGVMGGAPGQTQSGPALANGAALTNPNILAQLDAMLSQDPNLAGSLTGPIQQLAGPVTAANAAQQMLPGYQNTLAQGSAGGGPLGYLLSQLGGALTGGPAAQVGPQQQALQALLKQAGAPGMQVPGLFANQAGTAAGMAPTASVLGALGGQ